MNDHHLHTHGHPPHAIRVHKRMKDPTRTTALRNRFEQEVNKRFSKLRKLIVASVRDHDILALRTNAVPAARFEFSTDPAKINAFMKWVNTESNQIILGTKNGTAVTSASDAWANVYLDTAYQKGLAQAASELRGAGVKVSNTWVDSAFFRPVHADRVGIIYTRAFDDLKGINKEMGEQIGQVLATGIAEGRSPEFIAKTLADRVDMIGRTRARTLARTEVISAHATASLNAYREAGVEGVGVQAEFSTAGDDLVCPDCDDLEGQVFTLDEAEGLIPVHPNAVLEGSTFITYGTVNEMARAVFRGPAIHLRTLAGGTTIGPNHPVLTRSGWKRANELTEKDELLYDSRSNSSEVISETYLENVPLVQDAFISLIPGSIHSTVVAPTSYLHGDMVSCEGEVEVIHPTRQLLNIRELSIPEHLRQLGFKGTDAELSHITSLSASEAGLQRILHSASSGMGSALPSYFQWVPVLSVDVVNFEGYAYDCSTSTGVYCSDGFMVSNCRCAFLPVVDNPDDLSLGEGPDDTVSDTDEGPADAPASDEGDDS